MTLKTGVVLRRAAVNLAVLAGAWLVALLVGMALEFAFGWSRFVGISLVAVGGLYVARRLKASFALVVILGCAVSIAVELVASRLAGPGVIRGGEVLLTIWRASMVGVALGFGAALGRHVPA